MSAVSDMVVFAGGGTGRHVLVTEFRDIARNSLFCADVLRPHDRVPRTDFTYKYRPDVPCILLNLPLHLAAVG